MKLNRIFTVILAVCAAGMCFAPIEDKPGGSQFHRELTQEELARAQGNGSVSNPDMAAPRANLDQNETPGIQNNANAAGMLAKQGKNDANAAASLVQASKDSKKSKPVKAGGNAIFAGLFLIIGLACAYGVRMYLGKIVPESPSRKS